MTYGWSGPGAFRKWFSGIPVASRSVHVETTSQPFESFPLIATDGKWLPVSLVVFQPIGFEFECHLCPTILEEKSLQTVLGSSSWLVPQVTFLGRLNHSKHCSTERMHIKSFPCSFLELETKQKRCPQIVVCWHITRYFHAFIHLFNLPHKGPARYIYT